MTDALKQLTHSLAELKAILAEIPESATSTWVAHCITRLFFWRVMSLRWQNATPEQSAHLNTILHLSEATLFYTAADNAASNAASNDSSNASTNAENSATLIQQANHIADTLTALCQAQTNPERWHATIQPDQFRPSSGAAAATLLRMAQRMAELWSAGEMAEASTVLYCVPLFFSGAAPALPLELARGLIDLLQPQANQIVFDACCGSGKLLCHVVEYLRNVRSGKATTEARQALLIGQDAAPEAVALAHMNLAILGWGYTRWETWRAKRGATRQSPGLKQEGGQPLFADVVLAIVTEPPTLAWARHILASLHPHRGRMALVLDSVWLTTKDGKRLSQYLLDQKLLQAIIELPANCLPQHSITPICLMVNASHAMESVAFLSHRFNTHHVKTGKTGLDWIDILRAWQALLAGQPNPNYLSIPGAPVRQALAQLDALPFGVVWAALHKQCERIAEQEREQNRAIAHQISQARKGRNASSSSNSKPGKAASGTPAGTAPAISAPELAATQGNA